MEIDCRIATAARHVERDPDRVLAAAERAARELASSVGDDAAADFVAELIAVPIEGAAVRWRLADLARQWLRADRRDRPWALIRECELDRRDHEAPEAPGIPVDDDAYRELRNVFAQLPDEQRRSNYDTPATRAEAVAMLDTRAEIAFGWLWASGRWDLGVETIDDGIAEFRRQGLVGMEAFLVAVRSRLEMVLGRFDDAAADLDAALALLPRLSPDSNQAFQVLVTPTLNGIVCGETQPVGTVDLLLAFSELPDTRWAGLVLRMGAARLVAIDGTDPERAVALLDESISAVERAAPWAPNAPLVYQYAVEVSWHLGEPVHLEILTRVVREHWLEPDLRYPGADARWSLAKLCAVAGDAAAARSWFDESRRSLADEGAEAVIVNVDHDAAEMELRLGGAGDAGQFTACLAAARGRCTHPAMADWLPRLDALEARAAELWPN